MNTWLLIDSNYLCYRARWAMGDLVWQGRPTGIIYGFLQTILQLQRQFNTSNIAFCFDSRHSKRRDMYPPYKAHRKNRQPMTEQEKLWEREFHKQIALLRTSYLPQIGFNNVFIQKGYESDDLLAKLAATIENADVAIITADEDLFQCIRKNVFIYNPNKKTYMTYQRFCKTYELVPEQWTTVKSIAGCSTDNIKGLQGIGEKTVIKYLCSVLKESSKAFQTITKSEYEIRKQNLSLVQLPLAGTKPMTLQSDNISKAGWHSVCRKLGFKSLIDNVPGRSKHAHR